MKESSLGEFGSGMVDEPGRGGGGVPHASRKDTPLLEGHSEADSVHHFPPGSIFTAGIGLLAAPSWEDAAVPPEHQGGVYQNYLFFFSTAEEIDFLKAFLKKNYFG